MPGPLQFRCRAALPCCRAFSDFKVQKMLGEGVMSSVVHCVCGRSGVHAAIKMYHRDRMNAMNVKQVRGVCMFGGRRWLAGTWAGSRRHGW